MADETKTKEGDKGATPPPADPPEPVKGKDGEADAREHIKKLNDEAKQHRLRADKAEQELQKERDESKAFRLKLGEAVGLKPEKADEVPDAVKAAKDEADAKLSRVLLRSAFTAEVARDAHDVDDAFSIAAPLLKDIKVDLATETVDREAVKSKVAELRKSKPFLFGQPTKEVPKPVPPPPDKGGTPAPGSSNHYAHWRQLKTAGNNKEAQEYFAKHEKEITRGIPG